MDPASAQSGSSSPVSGAFAGSLYDEVAGYSSSDSLARQISQKLVYSARRGVRRLKMDLSPESLGRLSVELRVQGNKLAANIQADSAEAYQALESEVMALKDALAQEGIELKLTLSYAGSGGSQNSDGGVFQGERKSQTWLRADAEENSPEEPADEADLISGGLISAVV